MIKEIYVKNKDKCEGLELSMPITELELSDAYEELGTADQGQYEIWYGTECSLPYELQIKNCSLEELNCVAAMWERMDENQQAVFENLVPSGMEPVKAEDVIRAACRAENSKTIEGISNDRELGEYVLSKNESTKKVPPELERILDVSRIGKTWRELTQGIYTEKGYSYPQDAEPYNGKDLPVRPERYVFQIELSSEGGTRKLNLPADGETIRENIDAEIVGFHSILPQIQGTGQCGIDTLNCLATAIQEMPDAQARIAFHEYLQQQKCYDAQRAVELIKDFLPNEEGESERKLQDDFTLNL